MLKSRLFVLLTATLVLVLLQGADGCPLRIGTPASEQVTSASLSGGAMDIGGTSGAKWQLTFEDEIMVTLHQSGQTSSKKIKLQEGGVAYLLGNTIDLTQFCYRPNTLCPHQVLPASAAILQTQGSGSEFLVDFNRRGPLELLSGQSGLYGTIDGAEISVALQIEGQENDACSLATGSQIRGRVFAAATDEKNRASTMQGQITLIYGGSCLTINGAGAISAEAQVELSVNFTGQRQ